MFNNTEYNNVVICVLPVGVKYPTPKNYDAYCKKYAPKRTRKLGQTSNNFKWELIDDYLCTSVSTKHHKYEFGITEDENDFRMCVNEFFDDGTYVGTFEVANIPSIQDAMKWAERYVNSFVALWYDDRCPDGIEYEWSEVCDMDKVEEDTISDM